MLRNGLSSIDDHDKSEIILLIYVTIWGIDESGFTTTFRGSLWSTLVYNIAMNLMYV